MLRLDNITLVSIDSAQDHCSKNNIRLAAMSKIYKSISDKVSFGDYFFVNPFNKNKHLIDEKFECLWPMNYDNGINPIMWYSNFLIKKLPHLINTEYYLIVQWDGFVLNENVWDSNFLNYDFLGGGYSVFNGGFSLRKTETMREISKISDPYGTGAEDGFYSCFLNNEWMAHKQTPFKIEWANQKVCKKFCNFYGHKNDGLADTSFGWHRGAYTSEQFIYETYRNLQTFTDKELNKLKEYSLSKSIRKEVFVDSYIKEFDIDFDDEFFKL